MVKTRHPVFRDTDSGWEDPDDQILADSSGAIPDAVDRLFGFKKQEEEEE